MQANWLVARVKQGDEKKRKTGAGDDDVSPADRRADEWLANVKRVFAQEPSDDSFVPEIDRLFEHYVALLEALFAKRPFDKYEIRLYPAVVVRYRAPPGPVNIEYTDVDETNMHLHLFFLSEEADDANTTGGTTILLDREGGGLLSENVEFNDELMYQGHYIQLTVDDFIKQIKGTRRGIAEISMCGAVFESATQKMVFGPFNRILCRKEADAEEGFDQVDPADIEEDELNFVRED
jgi:hypothetical protein